MYLAKRQSSHGNEMEVIICWGIQAAKTVSSDDWQTSNKEKEVMMVWKLCSWENCITLNFTLMSNLNCRFALWMVTFYMIHTRFFCQFLCILLYRETLLLQHRPCFQWFGSKSLFQDEAMMWSWDTGSGFALTSGWNSDPSESDFPWRTGKGNKMSSPHLPSHALWFLTSAFLFCLKLLKWTLHLPQTYHLMDSYRIRTVVQASEVNLTKHFMWRTELRMSYNPVLANVCVQPVYSA